MTSGRRRSRWRKWPNWLAPLALVVVGAGPEVSHATGATPTLSRSTFAARGRQESILTVPSFGRYAIRARSAQGTALQLIDKLAGPSQADGTPGKADGRIDQFLDRGSYKVVTYGHPKAADSVTLEATGFAEKNGAQPPLLIDDKLVTTALGDFEQRSFWLDVRERHTVSLEAAGRHLRDLRLWSDGNWLVDASPSIEVVEAAPGKPLLTCRLSADLEPGLYLLTAYGGPSQAWTSETQERPLYLRSGIPKRPQVARSRHTISPFGIDRWLVPGEATYFRLELPEARPATLHVGAFDQSRPFDVTGTPAAILKTSLLPVAEMEATRTKWQVVTVNAHAGQPYVLQHFNVGDRYFGGRHWSIPRGDRYWVSTVHSGYPEDSIDATAILARFGDWDGTSHLEPLDTQVVLLDKSTRWGRRANLLDPLTLFLRVRDTGKYQVLARGPQVRFRVEPFMIYRPRDYEVPAWQVSGSSWDLDPGYYVLSADPQQRGVIDLGIVAGEAPVTADDLSAILDQSPPRQIAAQFTDLRGQEVHGSYGLYLNEQPEVRVGLVLRPLPTDLAEPLPVVLYPGDTVLVPFKVREAGVIRAETEDGGGLDVAVDEGTPQASQLVQPGEHRASIRWDGPGRVQCSLAVVPQRLQVDTPLPVLDAAHRATPPKFPILQETDPQYTDLERGARRTFVIKADAPALYKLQSTGLLATEGNLRTRTVASFDRQAENGVGRNFFIQQYLREGEYQVTVATRGQSRGHLGVVLERTQIVEGGSIREAAPARITLPAGSAVRYRFTISERGKYRLRSMGIGRLFRGRLEDAEGWPIEAANLEMDVTRDFDAGSYQVISLPEPVASRRLTVLERLRNPSMLTGHGPHPLPLAQSVTHIWHEPAAAAPRAPDSWEFEVPASIDANIQLTGEMQGELSVAGVAGATRPVATLQPGRGWSGRLDPGNYRLDVVCARVNNLAEYTVGVWPEQLTPGLDRVIDVPANLPLSVGEEGLVQLSSFGPVDVRAQLFDSAGRRLASNDDGPDDWNFQLQQRLQPGFYKLQVDPVALLAARILDPPTPTPTPAAYGGDDGGEGAEEGEETDAPDPVPTSASSTATLISMRARAEAMQAPLALPTRTSVELADTVLVYPLKMAADANLLAAGARSAEAFGLAIDVSADGQSWRSTGNRVGRIVQIEVPVRPAAQYRLRIWSLDGRAQAAQLSAAAVTATRFSEDQLRKGVTLPVLKDTDPPVVLAAIDLANPGTFRFAGTAAPDSTTWRSTGRAENACDPLPNGIVSTAANVLWLSATPAAGTRQVGLRAERLSIDPAPGRALQLAVGEGQTALCDLTDSTGPVLVTATAMGGQPGVRIISQGDAAQPDGAGMAIGMRRAVAASLDGRGNAAVVWSADDAREPALIKVSQLSFSKPIAGEANWGITQIDLDAVSARSLSLPPGKKRIRLSLQPFIVAVLSDNQHVRSIHWWGDEAFEEELSSTASVLTLLHTRPANDGARIEILPMSPDEAHPAASRDNPFEVVRQRAAVQRLTIGTTADRTAATLRVRGAEGSSVFIGRDGQVRRGNDLPLRTDGTLFVPHLPGLVLAWLDYGGDAGLDLWGGGALPEPVPVDVPAAIPLSGAAQAFWIKIDSPKLVQLRTSAPVVSLVGHEDGSSAVDVHPHGASVDVYAAHESLRIVLRSVYGGTMSGNATVTVSPVTALGEGSGPESVLGAGSTALFSFTVKREGPVGIGVRALPDVAVAALLDSRGRRLATGIVQMPTLKPGIYLLEVHAPANTGPVRIRPALAGIEKPSTAPPAEVVRGYMAMATAPEPIPNHEEE